MHFEAKKVIVVGGSAGQATPAAVKTPAVERCVPKVEIGAAVDEFAPLHPLEGVGTPVGAADAITLSALRPSKLDHRRDSQRRWRHLASRN
jgi:hypothetical protein